MNQNIREVKAACRGCHGGCMHILTVENEKVTKVRPDPDGPLNHGMACPKGMSIIEQMYHPDRLLYPLRRAGSRGEGKWERISWDEAYDEISDKLGSLIKEHGAECISMLTGTGRHHLPYYWRFANVLNTPNPSSAGALICLGPRMNSGMMTAGVFAGVDYYGDKPPAGILVWGGNPAVSGADGELQWHIKDAASSGTPLIVVDPQPTELAQKAEIWLRIRPGTDGALALAMLNVIIFEGLYDSDFVKNWCHGFDKLKERCQEYSPERAAEITWIPADQIRQAARRIAEIKPLSLEWGCAIEQSMNSIQTCRAIYMIPAITGNFDVPGGFVESQKIAPVAPFLAERMSPEQKAKCISGGYPNTTNMPLGHPHLILEAIKTGRPYKIRALLSNANNALLSLPDSRHVYDCLQHIEFFICMDIFMTPTAELADIVLPASLWAEIDELYCMPEFAEEAILCMRKAVQVGECKSDEEFFFELSSRMGLDYGAGSIEEIFDWQLAEMGRRRPEYKELDFKTFRELGYIQPRRTYYNYKARGGFNTPTGKFELWSTALEQTGGDPLPYWSEVSESPVSRPDLAAEYPLILTTGSRRQQYFISNNRQVKSLRRSAPFPIVTMHPDTAAAHGIADGDWVYIQSPRGRITQKASLTPEIDPRVVNCEMGWWYPEAGAPGYGWDESNVNILTLGDGPHDPYFGSYQLRALMCRISRNPECAIEQRYYDWIS